jgi:hypothetical protein
MSRFSFDLTVRMIGIWNTVIFCADYFLIALMNIQSLFKCHKWLKWFTIAFVDALHIICFLRVAKLFFDNTDCERLYIYQQTIIFVL